MGKQSKVGLLLVSAAYLACGCGTPPGGQPPSTWQEFTSREGRFAILMPGQPIQDTDVPAAGKGLDAFHKFSCYRDNKKELFMVWYTDLPDVTLQKLGADKLVDILTDGVAKDAKGTILDKRAVSLDGAAGAEVRVKTPGTGVITARVFVSRNWAYQVCAAMPTGKASSEDVQRFLDSFRLLK
jgi:hypothetical protein